LRKERDCADGRASGVAMTWDECGVLREEAAFTDGLLNGTRSLWDGDGRLSCITEYAHGLPNGEQLLFHKNGRVKQASSLVRGKQDGLVAAFDESNREVWRLSCCARDDTQRMISWHPNGAPCAEHCALGRLPEGLQREWYDDGSPRSCGVRVSGRMEGDWKFWTRDGDVDRQQSGAYVAGVKRR
jgi:antitoxin component YwqK of YwqJK toxin-antitoxin module